MSAATRPTSRLQWRELRPADLAAMHALHQASIRGLPPAIVKPESLDFLASLLHGRGRVQGAWDGDALVAYGVLQHDVLPADDPRAHLGLKPHQPVFKLAGAAVASQWRGHGLQRVLIDQRLAWATGHAVFATAAPGNPASWRSLLACGLSVRALEVRYGGLPRYLMARVPGDTFAADVARSMALGPEALDQQQTLLLQGWRGLAPGAKPGQLRLQPPRPEARS